MAFFPPDLDWEANHQQDRNTVFEFDDRPAPTLEIWREIMPDQEFQSEYWQLDTLPWYSNCIKDEN